MKSFTELSNLFGDLTKNTNAANISLGEELLNDDHRFILSSFPWPFLEKQTTINSVASQQNYKLPGDIDKLLNVTLTVGTTVYTPREVPGRRFWDRLNQTTSTKSDTPQWFFQFGNEILFYPTLSSSSNTITFNYRQRIRNLSVADFTSGTITTATNGDETIIGSSTNWTIGMANKWIKITDSNAADQGDGIWYEIGSITDGTNLELVAPYEGTSISSGTANYILGDVPQLPAAFQQLILWRPLADYWYRNDDADLAVYYERKFATGFELLKDNYGNKTDSVVIDTGIDEDLINPNLTITL